MAGFREGRYLKTGGEPKRSTSIAANSPGRTRAAGFGGQETDSATGNLKNASFESVYGRNPKQSTANPIRDVFADTPRPQMTGSGGNLLGSVAAKAAEKFGEKAIGRYLDRPQFEPIGPETGTYLPAGVQTSGAVTYPVSDPGAGITTTDIPSDVSVNPVSDPGAGLQSFDVPIDGLGVESTTSWAGDGLGFDAFGGDAAGAALGGEIPVIGPLVSLAQGNVGGAMGSVVGAAFGGPVGGAIGGLIGSLFDCFITEATMAGLGMDTQQVEQSEPLQVMRWWRDNVLSQTADGRMLVQQYYLMAPDVVAAVNSRPDSEQIYQTIFHQYLAPCVDAVKSGDNEMALKLYLEMISFVVPFGAEMMDDDGAAEEYGNQTAMESHDPQLQQAAVGATPQPGLELNKVFPR